MRAELAAGWFLTYLLHSTVLLGTAWLVTRRLKSPHARELFWKSALVGGLVTASLQIASGRAPLGGTFAIRRTPQAAVRAVPEVPPSVAARDGRRELASASEVDTEAPYPRTHTAATPAPRMRDAAPRAPWRWAFAAWAVAAALLALHYAVVKLLVLIRIGPRALVREPRLVELLDAVRRDAGFRTPVRLTRAEGLASPVALGTREICVPAAALTELDGEQQENVLAHELAHLARRDPLWLAAACLLERVLFVQPLNRLARRRIQEEAEIQCDDWAVRRAGSGLTLAKCLVKVAEWIDAAPDRVPVSGMAELRSQFVDRIQRLVANHALESRPRARWAAAAAMAAVAAVALAVPGFSAVDPREASATPAETVKPADPVAAALVDTLKDPDTEVRRAAARSLGNRGDGRVVPALVGALSDEDVEVRRAASAALAERREPRVTEALAEAVKDPDAEVRMHAAAGLAASRDERGLAALAGLTGDPSPGVRRHALAALGDREGKVSTAPFLAALKDEDAEVRQVAASALADHPDPQAVAPLRTLLADRSAEVRQAAARALGELRAREALPELLSLLSDPHAEVRHAGVQAIGELRLAEAPAPLLSAAADESSEVRQGAARALGEIGDARAVSALSRLVSDDDPEVRAAAVEALGEMRDASATRALVEATKSRDARVRRHAAEALGERREP